jgi:outer membrane lipoprotein-sorting protein
MSRMRRVLCCVLVCGGLSTAAHAASLGPDPRTIVENADRIRNIAPSYVMDVEVATQRPGRPTATARYEVFDKDKVKSLVKFKAPASEKGKALLMVNQDMWIYIPTTSRPIRLSPLQRLVGDVANGDIARTNYGDDYLPVLVGEERYDGKDCHLLELTAKNGGISYHRIRYWVEKETYHPVRAEFYTLSNKLLKTGDFHYSVLRGVPRVTELIIRDPTHEGHQSIVHYSNFRVVGLSDDLFRQESLRNLP